MKTFEAHAAEIERHLVREEVAVLEKITAVMMWDEDGDPYGVFPLSAFELAELFEVHSLIEKGVLTQKGRGVELTMLGSGVWDEVVITHQMACQCESYEYVGRRGRPFHGPMQEFPEDPDADYELPF